MALAYTAESRSLGSLEILVHTEDTQLLSSVTWAAIPVEIDLNLMEVAEPLPADWQRLPAPLSTRQLGSRWVAESRSVVLKVPSIVIPAESNYLINPRHPNFSRLRIGEPTDFAFDPRL